MGEAEEPLLQWVAQVRNLLDYRRPEGNAGKIPRVATHLLNEKPEVYIPQYVSLGPYHHWRLGNRVMLSPAEAYKVQSTATFWPKRDGNLNVIVEDMRGRLQEIEEFYGWPISRDGEYPQQFALMMAIDLSFLLRFLLLQSGDLKYNGGLGHLRRLDEISVKCDILKLENQIPLSALQTVFNEALRDADDVHNFSNWLQITCKKLSPFEQFDMENSDSIAQIISEQTHLLGCVHAFVSPLLNIIDLDNMPERRTPLQVRLNSFVKRLKERASRLPDWTRCLVTFLLSVEMVKRLKERASRLPDWTRCLVTFLLSVEMVSYGNPTAPLEGFAELVCVSLGMKLPSIDILHSFNATKLEKAGIKFKSFSKQPYGIRFDEKSGTLYLPRLTVSEMQTEVVFRNMLALEFNEEDTGRGDSVTRYVGLIDCLIGTTEDVRVLRESRVILPASITLTDEKIAGMWNGMCYPLFTDRLDPPPHLCSALNKVLIRKYYMKCCTNKLKKVLQIPFDAAVFVSGPPRGFVRFVMDKNFKYVRFLSAPIRERLSDPGKGAAMLVGLLVLLMTAVQTYCALATFLKGK